MPLIFITGLPGSGKSALVAQLAGRGFKAVDGDNYSRWWDTQDEVEVTAVPDGVTGDRYQWSIDVHRVTDLKRTTGTGFAFVGASVANDGDVWDLFDTKVYLDVTNATVTTRLQSRTDNDYGRSESQLTDVLTWNDQGLREWYRNRGAFVVDANGLLMDVLSRVLTVSGL